MKIPADRDFSPFSSLQYGRAVVVLLVAAAVLLVLFSGRESLAAVEGGSANGARLLSLGYMPQEAGPRLLWHALIMRWPLHFFGLSEMSVRLPSAVAAFLTLAGTLLLAGRCVGKKGALLVGWMLLGSYGFLYWGRSAAGAIFPALSVVWAAMIGEWREKSFSFLRCFCAGVLLFSSFVFLNNLAFLFILLLWLPELFSFEVWRRKGKWEGMFGFLFAFLTVAAAAFALTSFHSEISGGEFWKMICQGGHHPIAQWIRHQKQGFSFSALFHLPRLLLPWTVFTVVAVMEVIRHRKRIEPRIFRLGISLILMFLSAGIWPARRWGALLPLLPFCLIVTGAGLDTRLGLRLVPFLLDRLMRVLLTVTAALITVFPVSWPLWNMLLGHEPDSCVLLAMPFFGLLALGILNGKYLPRCDGFLKKLLPSRYAGAVLSAVVVMGALLCVFQPGMSPFRTGKRFWDAVREKKQAKGVKELLFFQSDPSGASLFYLDLPHAVPAVQDRRELERLLSACRDKDLLIIAKRSEKKRSFLEEAARNTGWVFPEKEDVSEDAPLQFFHPGNPGYVNDAELFGAWILQNKNHYP